MKALRFTLLVLALGIPAAAFAQVNDTYIIPVAGSTAGAFGTRWKTQFSVFNPQRYDLRVSVTLVPTGGAKGTEAIIRVPANAVAFSEDVIRDLFNQTNATGSLLVATFPEDNPGVPNDVLSRSFLVITETYNDSTAGTFGQTIPGIWAGLQDYTKDGISAVAHGVKNIASQGWRANIGAVNLGRSSVTMRITVFDVDGNTVRRDIPFVLPPLGHFQDRLPVEVNAGSLEFFIDDPKANDPTMAAVVFPYVSVVDQFSGDPKYQSPVLLASASVLFKMAAQPTTIGKKIDIDIARRVRDNAERIGEIKLNTQSR